MELKFVLPPLTAKELGIVLASLSKSDDLAVANGQLDNEWAVVYRKIDGEKQVVAVPL
jgi:hypothetical protein